jgi:D-proline reductase (dithiol) PrdB
MTQAEHDLGFAPEHDAPIPYMQRIRGYYRALGYATPYRWAHYAEVPFQPLTNPLGASRVALITTAAPYQPGKGDQDPGAPYNAAAKFYTVYSGDSSTEHDLRISHPWCRLQQANVFSRLCRPCCKTPGSCRTQPPITVSSPAANFA